MWDLKITEGRLGLREAGLAAGDEVKGVKDTDFQPQAGQVLDITDSMTAADTCVVQI